MPQRRAALEKLVLHATNLRIPIVEVEGGSLTALAGFDGHQGVALVVEPRRFAGLADILARAAERGEPPFVLVLDSLQDPHNVGSLLRSAEAAGVHGVIFPSTRQAPLSPSAIKASAGAVEHLLLAPVDDLPGALSDLHAHGLRVAGAEGDAPMTARQADLRGPLAIVIGSEGQGLGPAVRRRCDLFVRIPMRGAVGSLNAAVAGSILVFEAVNQRDLPERPPTPATGDPTVEPADAAPLDASLAKPSRSTRSTKTKATKAVAAEADAPAEPEASEHGITAATATATTKARVATARPAKAKTTKAKTTRAAKAESTDKPKARTTGAEVEAPREPAPTRPARTRSTTAASKPSGPIADEASDALAESADDALLPETKPKRRASTSRAQRKADPPSDSST